MAFPSYTITTKFDLLPVQILFQLLNSLVLSKNKDKFIASLGTVLIITFSHEWARELCPNELLVKANKVVFQTK